MEEWKTLIDYIEVSNKGNVRVNKNNNIKSKYVKCDKYGYKYFEFTKNYKTNYLYIHKCVCKLFLGEKPQDKDCIDHKDRNRKNNELSNLRYVSLSENALNRERKGTIKQLNNNKYQVNIQVNKKRYSKRFINENDAINWLNEKKQIEVFF